MKSNTKTSFKFKTLVKKVSPSLCAPTQANMTRPTLNRRYGRVRTGPLFGLITLALVGLSGCVSSGKYEAMVTERDGLLEEQALLSSRVAETEQQKKAAAMKADEALAEVARQKKTAQMKDEEAKAEIERQKKAAAMKDDEAKAAIARQEEVYNSLQATFAKEQQANQVKIEMMKSGVKVNLANDILFPSGSADLNDSGVEVLARAAGELKKSPYQAVVAGFTDDVAISGKLKDKYPTNWELAGARAASVVRLLEKEGVAPAQLLAVSFGENNPAQPNDTTEGRSKNRRIEIILRPVPVTMN